MRLPNAWPTQTCLSKPVSSPTAISTRFPYRVAILGSRGIPARYGGFETFAEQLALGLTHAGVEVTVFAEAAADQAAQPAFDHQEIRVQPIRLRRLGPATTIWYDLVCLWRARRGFDVVYMLGYGAAFACWLPRCWGTQVWINMDGLEWKRSKWHPLARAYLRAMEACMARVATRVLADAQAIQAYYQHRYPTGAPATFIPYGAHLPASADAPDALAAQLHTWHLTPDGYLLIVARMEPENHIVEMLQAYLAVADRVPWPLVVVGEHRANNAYCARLRHIQHDHIRFIGTVYDAAQLTALRRGARAYLHGHSVGGTNPSLLEAMACANLVIAHDNPFNREVLDNQGLYFADASTLSALLIQLTTLDEDTRHAHQRAVWHRVQTTYSWSRVAAAYLALIAQDAPRPQEAV